MSTTDQSAPATGAAPGDAPPQRYTAALAAQVELAWQQRWADEGTFEAPNPSGPWGDAEAVAGREPLFVMDMFPYPSGAGLHVGHPLGYIATDVWARYQRMNGRNVLHTLGYDAFGLPAEQYAVQTGQHPRVTTEANIATMRRQLRRLGLAHDARRSVSTIDPDYYRWTQWIFREVFESWYDPEAVRPDGGRGAARPVAELREAYESGARQPEDGSTWADLDDVARRRLVDDQRLAYISEAPVNWCPGLGTVLANEEVTADGRSERGNFPVVKRPLRQWMMRITAYADRLVDDLDRLDWPEAVKSMQRHWIGRSTGAQVRFALAGDGVEGGQLEVFTTRPDTLFGVTFMVVAPEHASLDELPAAWPAGTPDSWTGGAATPAEAVAAYRTQAAARTEAERTDEGRTKTGVFTGLHAVNPVTGTAVPVFTADYVLAGYGTGAIMAVPGQDERDFAFAERFELPVVRTVQPPEGFEGGAYTGAGPAINSSNDDVDLDGLEVAEAKERITAWLEATGAGRPVTTYRLRDWLFSRQRYWGEPFPVVYDEHGLPRAVPADQLPVLLPDVPDYSPRTFEPDDVTSEPSPPLSRVPEWVDVTLDLGDGPKRYRRETNTMPNWAGSCWYELRYLDPENSEKLVDPEVEAYWMGPRTDRAVRAADGTAVADTGGVDLYVGGVEHAVLHLLYARFWHKVLFDLGHVSSQEPFRRLFNQGYIQADAFTDVRGTYVPAAEVEETTSATGAREFTWQGEPVTREYGKMGKSLKNVVTPDDMYESYGADTFRVYEMSMGPLDDSRPWETRAVVGSQRFLQRLWRNVVDESTGEVTVSDAPADPATRALVHRTAAAVAADYEGLRFNTAVSKLIELNNELTKLSSVPREAAEALVLMVAPLAPHVAEELWSRLGHSGSLAFEGFPQADPALLVQQTVTCVVQLQGKVRDRLEVPADITEDALREQALASPALQRALDGRGVRTVIVRAPKLVNVVPA
ncbi:leucine--tRNA ligase [Quadrisphaera oryzae]|uniref:leucine--tRNA ligase n=1 Tax=Quadrisphaera TaxID=317661 RepID=UPI001648FFB0|nr:leucine--tRNA ligase [Quadrisphaera sp. RL12-1S]MBC3763052.1 leucine--tRNA ligase [Quadrisphaera sp. RL12-1S]